MEAFGFLALRVEKLDLLDVRRGNDQVSVFSKV